MLFQPSECDELAVTAPVAIVSDRGGAATTPLETLMHASRFPVKRAATAETAPVADPFQAQIITRRVRRGHYVYILKCRLL